MNSDLTPKYDLDKLTNKEKELLASLPFPDLVFRKLFDHLDEMMGVSRCDNTFAYTELFLAKNGIHFSEHKEFFQKHGASCDCEVITIMEEVFPVDLNEFKRNSF